MTATFVILALAIGALSFIISTSRLSAPARIFLARQANPQHGHHRVFAWIFDLVSCAFCTGTWLSLAATAIFRHELPGPGFGVLGNLGTALALSSAAMLAVLVIRRAVM